MNLSTKVTKLVYAAVVDEVLPAIEKVFWKFNELVKGINFLWTLTVSLNLFGPILSVVIFTSLDTWLNELLWRAVLHSSGYYGSAEGCSGTVAYAT